jgi:ribonuclease HII
MWCADSRVEVYIVSIALRRIYLSWIKVCTHSLLTGLPITHHTISYIDTVGIADSYRSKLERVFEGKGITFIVEKKADAKYAPCSAASVGK